MQIVNNKLSLDFCPAQISIVRSIPCVRTFSSHSRKQQGICSKVH